MRATDGNDIAALQALRRLLEDAPGLVSDRVHLLSLELQRVSRIFVRVLALTVGAALFGATAWFSLCITAGALAVRADLPWAAVAVAIVLVNAVLAAWAAAGVARIAPLLTLPATVRSLTSARPHGPPAEASKATHER